MPTATVKPKKAEIETMPPIAIEVPEIPHDGVISAPPTAAVASIPTQQKFIITRQELSDGLIERDAEIDMILTAILAGEHALLVGEPGTAKSMLCDAITEWLHGNRFAILLTKFTTPDEVFGPISLTELKRDRFIRLVDGYLPWSHVAFIDEIWKASSAILNTFMRTLHERIFYNGGVAVSCPLQFCLAASNEWPGRDGAEELTAVFDRFLFRKTVHSISSHQGMERLMFDDVIGINLSTSIDVAELESARAQASQLLITDAAKDAFRTILQQLRKEGIVPGDRRIRKSVHAARAFAYLAGATEVEPDHLECLQHVLWADPAEQPAKCAEVVLKIANPTGMQVTSLLAECSQIMATTDVNDLQKVSAAVAKMNEIHKKLNAIQGGNGRSEKAKAYVKEQITHLRRVTLDSL